MKLVRFDVGRGPRLGALTGEGILDLGAAAQDLAGKLGLKPADAQAWFGRDMESLIAAGPKAWDAARGLIPSAADASSAGHFVRASAARLLAPLARPSKIIAVGLNYMDHCREQKIDPPKSPVLFSKAPSSLIGPGDAIRWPEGLTEQVDPEVELGIVAAGPAKALSTERALEGIFGYTIVNDVSARDLQFSDGQWVRGKSLDTFCPIGPAIATLDEIADPQALALACRVNGRIWQNSSTKEMIFPVRELMAFISRGITLLPGDLIATGTPHGVGVFQKPPVFLSPGDTVSLNLESVGLLENPVAGPG